MHLYRWQCMCPRYLIRLKLCFFGIQSIRKQNNYVDAEIRNAVFCSGGFAAGDSLDFIASLASMEPDVRCCFSFATLSISATALSPWMLHFCRSVWFASDVSAVGHFGRQVITTDESVSSMCPICLWNSCSGPFLLMSEYHRWVSFIHVSHC